jgi:hypothetical protein
MTDLTKTISRKTSAAIHEKSKRRRIILSFEPPAKVGVRLEGTRDTYKLDAEAVYVLAIKVFVADVERKAKRLMKDEGLPKRSALAKARKELRKTLKV